MAENVCPQCGAPIDPSATECKFCGEKLAVHNNTSQQMYYNQPPQQPQQVYYTQPPQQVIIQQMTPQQQAFANGVNPNWPVKSKITAGILALILGGWGIHKFYMGKVGLGIVYLLFCWTFIPAIVGFIEGLVYLCSSDLDFQLKNQVRIL